MALRLYGILVILAAVATPFRAAAESCDARDASVLIRGEEFRTVPLTIHSGSVRIGGSEFHYVSEEAGWSVTRPGDSSLEVGPPTQITVSKGSLEVRSLDRRTENFDAAPDAVLTAISGESGTEIRVAAKGDARVEVAGRRRSPASKELAVGCSGISLFVALGVL